MQRRRDSRGDIFGFGDPFADFGFGRHRSLMSGFFGRDPFDDPFFNRPFESVFGPRMLGPSIFDHPASGFVQHEAQQPNKSSVPIIEELPSDDEDEHKRVKDEEGAPRRHSRSIKEPFVQHPEEETEEYVRDVQHTNGYNRAQRTWPQSQSFSFQSSTVTYGGANGAYYTSSTTRRTGSDGLAVEESKEADTTTRRANHRISRGIGNKGHSVMRKLNSDGKVNTMQTLHNLNEDELAGFEETWKGKSKKHLPGWNYEFAVPINGHGGARGSGHEGESSGGWALPSTELLQNQGDMRSEGKGKAAAFRRA